MQLQQLVCHSGNIFMRSLIELQEASVGQKSFFLHGGTVTGQLFLTTVRSGVVEVQDVFHSGTDHFHGGIIYGSKIIRYDAVNIGSVHGCIQQHHRHLSGSAEDVFVVIFLLVDKIGTYQYNAVHFFRDQKVHGTCFGIQIITGTAQDAVVTVGPKLLLNIVDRFGKVRIRTVGTHDTDGLHGVET